MGRSAARSTSSQERSTRRHHLAAIDGEAVMDAVRSEVGLRVLPGGASSEATRDTVPSAWGVAGRRTWLRFRNERASFDDDRSKRR